MKMITAIIPEDCLDAVRESLIAAEITRITVSRVSGHGRQMPVEVYRGKTVVPNLVRKMRLEIAVNDEFVKPTVDAIVSAIRNGAANEKGKEVVNPDGTKGRIGSGKIFVMPLEQCIRVRTGEVGGTAI
jgi:nitrogen regulatory protein P-II 1